MTKKLNSRWTGPAPVRYSDARLIDDPTQGDSVSETTWVTRRKAADGWRNGARVRKIDTPK